MNRKLIKGFPIIIENTIGSIRKGIDEDGNAWSTQMKNEYGYFENTIGADGDGVDCFLGPVVDSNFSVYVINQNSKDGSFDETKTMFGFESREKAKQAYLNNYQDDWQGFDSMITYSLSEFKSWLNNKGETIHPAKQINMNVEAADEDRTKVIEMFGEVIEGETLKNLQEQAGDPNSFDILVIEIASPGGSVSEGLEIMVWLDKLSQSGKKIVTCVVANAYSIASLIMLTADMRLISKHGEVMVHNPMVPQLEYANANELQGYVDELRILENMMYDIYQMFTGLNQEQIKSLMDGETYLSPDDSIKHGFADTVIDIKKRSYEMAVNLKSEINMSKTLNILNKVIAMVNKSDFVNQLYYTQDGGEIEIYQADPATYKVGDRVQAEDGEMQLSDGAKLIVKGGVIEDINRDVEEAPIEEPAAEEVVEEVAPEAAVEVAPEVTEEVAPEAAEFNEGPAPEEVIEEAKAEEVAPEVAPEVVPEVATEATPEVAPEVVIEEAKAEEVVPEVAPVIEEEVKAEVVAPEVAPVVEPSFEDIVKAFEQRIAQLEEEAKATEAKFENLNKFETVATTAIDSIYKNTSSSFSPEAKSVVEVSSPKGSLFTQMKHKAGLK